VKIKFPPSCGNKGQQITFDNTKGIFTKRPGYENRFDFTRLRFDFKPKTQNNKCSAPFAIYPPFFTVIRSFFKLSYYPITIYSTFCWNFTLNPLNWKTVSSRHLDCFFQKHVFCSNTLILIPNFQIFCINIFEIVGYLQCFFQNFRRNL
jgi:hypothetical protein